MLRVRDLTVSYGPIRALTEVSIDVEEGAAVGIIGPNGAGKSTLMLTLAGVIQPDSGSIELRDESVAGVPSELLVKKGIALVPEARHIFRMLSVEENLLLGGAARDDMSALRQEMDVVLELFPGLKGYFHSSAGTLSGGEQQQLAIARALLSRPSLLLLDEPTLGLAPVVVDTVFQALKELRGEGTTFLMVEQNASRTVEFVDYLYVLRSGTVALEGPATELAREADFESFYLGGAAPS